MRTQGTVRGKKEEGLGYSEHISKEKAEEMGIRAFVMKPVVMRDMANTVRRVLDEQTFV